MAHLLMSQAAISTASSGLAPSSFEPGQRVRHRSQDGERREGGSCFEGSRSCPGETGEHLGELNLESGVRSRAWVAGKATFTVDPARAQLLLLKSRSELRKSPSPPKTSTRISSRSKADIGRRVMWTLRMMPKVRASSEPAVRNQPIGFLAL